MNDRTTDPCPPPEVLGAYAEGGLDDDARERVEAHLAACDGCRAVVRDLADALETQGGAPSLADAALAQRIRSTLPREATPASGRPASKPEGGRMSRTVQLVLAVAAALLIGVGLHLVLDRGSHRGPDVAPGLSTDLPLAQAVPIADVTVPARAPDLGGRDRYLAHLSTDKPLYRPGERLYGRAVVLEAFGHTPYAGRGGGALAEIKSARGEVVHTIRARTEDGVSALGWQLPRDLPGGVYTLSATFPGIGAPKTETTFDVRRYRVPRLKTDLQFLRKAYGPGDTVVASLEVTRAEGGVPQGAEVVAVARVDGEEIMRDETLVLDASGRCRIEFELLDEIEAGTGTLAFQIFDGGVRETAAKTIPIVLNRVDLRFLPEGGDLVADVPCGLYFQARDTRGDPADVKGRIEDERGEVVARFESAHEGRGMLTFVPRADASYRAVVEEPAGIADAVALPAADPFGISLRALAPRYEGDGAVEVALASPTGTLATVGLYVRERELALQPVLLKAGQPARVSLRPAEAASGVLRVTVFDGNGTPRAERLVFRRPAKAVNVQVLPDATATVPGGPVNVRLRATDALGRPVRAVFGVAATDDAVLATVEPRERAPRLPVQALLGAEVLELRDPAAYLDGDGARLDLLLGTQGWRRFAFFAHQTFVAEHEDAARRALALRLPPPRPRFGAGGVGRGPVGGGAPMPGAAEAGGGGGVEVADGMPGEEPEDEGGAEEDADEALGEVAAEAGAVAEEVPPPGLVPAKDDEAGRKRARRGRFGRPLESWMRVYAHEADPDRPAGRRTDFTETVYWNAALATDDEGQAVFRFAAADSITTIRIRADGVTADGALGAADATVEVRRPFYVEPKFPLEVSAGDRVQLPVVLVNGTAEPMVADVTLETGEGLRPVEGPALRVDLPASASVRRLVTLAVGDRPGAATVRVRATAGAYADDVTREIQVAAAGFPIELSFGGVLEGRATQKFAVPGKMLPGTLRTETVVYPTPLASLSEALAALLREPCGCFEQTSSTNYPNVMALQYMASHAAVDPAMVKRARDLLDRGYKMLVAFECKQKGYEWFGGDPGHEALTAYGVLEFHDMAKVMPVDADMLARTRQWLLSRRDGEGGFQRNGRALDRFGAAPQDITNAYILWALLETGEKGLEPEVAALKAKAAESKDSYLLALAANVLWLSGDHATAKALMTRLSAAQAADGFVDGATTSITRSGGASLQVETTSLAILAWLRSPDHTKSVEAATRWLAARCQGGRFGSTQATVLALKAITAYDAARARPKAAGKVTLVLNGQPLETVAFPADQQGPIRLPDLAERVGPGEHEVRLEMEGGGDMPFAFTVRYNATTPATAPAAKVSVATRLARTRVQEGESVEVAVDVRNTTAEGQPMAVAIVGIPGGLEARAAQLKELVREKKVDAFETRGREVVLYWRDMAPGARHDLTIDCVAQIPGTYAGPASRAYLYYTDEDKAWVDGLTVEIAPR